MQNLHAWKDAKFQKGRRTIHNSSTVKKFFNDVMNEMLQTERANIGEIKRAHQNYEKLQQILPADFALSKLLLFLPEYLKYSEKVVSGILSGISRLKNFQKFFQDIREQFIHVYKMYVLLYSGVEQEWSQINSNEQYRSIMRQCQANSNDLVDLDGYLIRPIQRMMKYHLLFDTSIKDPTLTEDEKDSILETSKLLREYNAEINRFQRQISMEINGKRILNSMVGVVEPFTMSDVGHLLIEGYVTENGKRRYMAVYIRIVFIFKEYPDKSLMLKNYFTPNTFAMLPIENTTEVLITVKSKKTLLKWRNISDKEEWLKYLRIFMVLNIPNTTIPSIREFLQNEKKMDLYEYVEQSTDYSADDISRLIEKIMPKKQTGVLQRFRPNKKPTKANEENPEKQSQSPEASLTPVSESPDNNCQPLPHRPNSFKTQVMDNYILNSADTSSTQKFNQKFVSQEPRNSFQSAPSKLSVDSLENSKTFSETDDESTDSSAFTMELVNNVISDLHEMQSEQRRLNNFKPETEISLGSVRATLAVFEQLSKSKDLNTPVSWSMEAIKMGAEETQRILDGQNQNEEKLDNDDWNGIGQKIDFSKISEFDSSQGDESPKISTHIDESESKDVEHFSEYRFKSFSQSSGLDIAKESFTHLNEKLFSESLNSPDIGHKASTPGQVEPQKSKYTTESPSFTRPDEMIKCEGRMSSSNEASPDKNTPINAGIRRSSNYRPSVEIPRNIVSQIRSQLITQLSDDNESNSADMKNKITPNTANTIGQRLMQLQACINTGSHEKSVLMVRIGKKDISVDRLPPCSSNDDSQNK